LRAACGNEEALYQRVKPYASLVREDSLGYPVVIPSGDVYVTESHGRRSTGAHYTPPSLTEPIVQYTLEPLVYAGPAEGWPRERWLLRSPKEILALRVCDMAMGSGAFLVQVCRYLAERLVEAWGHVRDWRGRASGGDARRRPVYRETWRAAAAP
jgi:type I restriction-modification system DNA methylase subunit